MQMKRLKAITSKSSKPMPSALLVALVAKLEHPNEDVRRGALDALGGLGKAIVTQHADAVVARLEDCV